VLKSSKILEEESLGRAMASYVDYYLERVFFLKTSEPLKEAIAHACDAFEARMIAEAQKIAKKELERTNGSLQ
jgi:hypothetical protein